MAAAHIAPPATSIIPVMISAVSNRVSQLLRMVRLNCWAVSDYNGLEQLILIGFGALLG